ncbi:MAG: hypothetical protein Q4B67_03390 [Eubacteriales bacterium]|nr:hypothetical protein [Eubacteriales bacterium]
MELLKEATEGIDRVEKQLTVLRKKED